MAYICIMASVRSDRVAEIRTYADIVRVASKVGFASHYIVLALPEIQEAMDGGIPLDTETSHPLRGFMLHQPAAVQQYAARLATVASDTSQPIHSDDFVRIRLGKYGYCGRSAVIA